MKKIEQRVKVEFRLELDRGEVRWLKEMMEKHGTCAHPAGQLGETPRAEAILALDVLAVILKNNENWNVAKGWFGPYGLFALHWVVSVEFGRMQPVIPEHAKLVLFKQIDDLMNEMGEETILCGGQKLTPPTLKWEGANDR